MFFGGNGVGKFIMMVGFVIVLIFDLMFLNFCNIIEVGLILSFCDKGLYGKLKVGVCYVVLESMNFCG